MKDFLISYFVLTLIYVTVCIYDTQILKIQKYKNTKTTCFTIPKYCPYTYVFKFMTQLCFHNF